MLIGYTYINEVFETAYKYVLSVFVLSRCFLDFSVVVGAFVIGLNQISSFSLHITSLLMSSLLDFCLSELQWQ